MVHHGGGVNNDDDDDDGVRGVGGGGDGDGGGEGDDVPFSGDEFLLFELSDDGTSTSLQHPHGQSGELVIPFPVVGPDRK